MNLDITARTTGHPDINSLVNVACGDFTKRRYEQTGQEGHHSGRTFQYKGPR